MTIFPRLIPVLTIRDGLLVKPLKFGKETYIGDPVNAVRIFNEKQVDELVICDLGASERGNNIDFPFLEDLASEAFMPIAYGGGVSRLSDAQTITNLGIEKVIVNSALRTQPELITEIAADLGSQSTVVSIDAKKRLTGGYETYSRRGTEKLGTSPVDLAVRAEQLGAGELILQSIDRESTFQGYDLKLLHSVLNAVSVPVVTLGGANGLSDFAQAFQAGASGVAAGSTFVMQGKHRAVLITYPSAADVRSLRAAVSDAAGDAQ